MDRVGPENRPDQTGMREDRHDVAGFEMIYALRRMNYKDASREQLFREFVEGKRRDNSAIVC